MDPHLPKDFGGNTPFEKSMNQLKAAIKSVRPAQGSATTSPFGSTSYSRNNNTQGMVLWVPVCLRDGSGEKYIPFRVAGEPVDEADIPEGSYIFDPTP